MDCFLKIFCLSHFLASIDVKDEAKIENLQLTVLKGLYNRTDEPSSMRLYLSFNYQHEEIDTHQCGINLSGNTSQPTNGQVNGHVSRGKRPIHRHFWNTANVKNI